MNHYTPTGFKAPKAITKAGVLKAARITDTPVEEQAFTREGVEIPFVRVLTYEGQPISQSPILVRRERVSTDRIAELFVSEAGPHLVEMVGGGFLIDGATVWFSALSDLKFRLSKKDVCPVVVTLAYTYGQHGNRLFSTPTFLFTPMVKSGERDVALHLPKLKLENVGEEGFDFGEAKQLLVDAEREAAEMASTIASVTEWEKAVSFFMTTSATPGPRAGKRGRTVLNSIRTAAAEFPLYLKYENTKLGVLLAVSEWAQYVRQLHDVNSGDVTKRIAKENLFGYNRHAGERTYEALTAVSSTKKRNNPRAAAAS